MPIMIEIEVNDRTAFILHNVATNKDLKSAFYKDHGSCLYNIVKTLSNVCKEVIEAKQLLGQRHLGIIHVDRQQHTAFLYALDTFKTHGGNIKWQ